MHRAAVYHDAAEHHRHMPVTSASIRITQILIVYATLQEWWRGLWTSDVLFWAHFLQQAFFKVCNWRWALLALPSDWTNLKGHCGNYWLLTEGGTQYHTVSACWKKADTVYIDFLQLFMGCLKFGHLVAEVIAIFQNNLALWCYKLILCRGANIGCWHSTYQWHQRGGRRIHVHCRFRMSSSCGASQSARGCCPSPAKGWWRLRSRCQSRRPPCLPFQTGPATARERSQNQFPAPCIAALF